MKTRLVAIGNSRGVRIPKALLEQSKLAEEVEISVLPGEIRLRSIDSPREDWEKAFQSMAKQGDDSLLDTITSNDWDSAEWQW